MICAHPPRHRNIARHGRPRNLVSRELPYFLESTSWKNCESLLKDQTGRPYSAPYGGPHRVLFLFLAEDPVLLYHRRKFFTSPEGVQFPRSPNRRLVQNTRAPPPDATAIWVLFRPNTSEIPRNTHILLKIRYMLIADLSRTKD